MGVHEMGLRKSILHNLDHYREKQATQEPAEPSAPWDEFVKSKVSNALIQ